MEKIVRVYKRRLRIFNGFDGEICCSTAPRSVEDLANRTGFLMISIKNRLFTSALVKAYCQFASEHLRVGCITVVDSPYIHNIMAARHEPYLLTKQINAVRRLSDERRQQVQKIIQRFDQDRIEFIVWDDLAAQTPAWLEAEIRSAFNSRGEFYSNLLEQTRLSIGGTIDDAALERYALFVVEETPVLLYCYYVFRGGTADFYPGEIPNYFWRIERGDFADELPQTTAMAAAHQGLTYIDFRKANIQPNRNFVSAPI